MLDLKRITENYRNYDDVKIRQIASNESKGLREEVLPILIAEIERRNLGSKLIEWINAENRKLTKNELEDLKNKVKSAPCFFCGKSDEHLKGFEFSTTVSYIIRMTTIDHSIISCRKCGVKRRRHSGTLTLILGWWSPWGILSTPFELISKIKAAHYEDQESEKIIEHFITDNIGKITQGNDSTEIINLLLKTYHQREIKNTNDFI